MAMKYIGAFCVMIACSWWGITLAKGYTRQVMMLNQLRSALQMMKWELSYRCTPLPDLCAAAADGTSGLLRKVFHMLSETLEAGSEADAYACMRITVRKNDRLPPKVSRILLCLGKTLGRYDLEGQLQGMDQVIAACEQAYCGLEKDRKERTKSYKTLGICAGAALVVLFI